MAVSGLSVAEVVEVIRNAPVEFLATVKPVASARKPKQEAKDVMYADIVHNDINGFQVNSSNGPIVEHRTSPQMINCDSSTSIIDYTGSPRSDRVRSYNAAAGSPKLEHRVDSPLNDHRSSPPIPPRVSKLPPSTSDSGIDDIDDQKYAVVKEHPKRTNGFSSESSPEVINLFCFSETTQYNICMYVISYTIQLIQKRESI